MAKKKTTAKKAVRKTVRKAVKKVAKKRTNVRKKIQVEVPEEVSDVNQMPLPDAEMEQVDQQGVGQSAENMSNSAILQEIEVIDLRGLKVLERILVLAMLEDEGYLTEHAEPLMSISNVNDMLSREGLVFQHFNKLVSSIDDGEMDIYNRISRVSVRHKTHIGFSCPEPAYKDHLRIGNAEYIRIG